MAWPRNMSVSVAPWIEHSNANGQPIPLGCWGHPRYREPSWPPSLTLSAGHMCHDGASPRV